MASEDELTYGNFFSSSKKMKSKKSSKGDQKSGKRRARTGVDFRTNRGGATTNRITRDGLVDKFEAATDFEREMADALEKAGMEDKR